MTLSSAAPANAHIKLAFHTDESPAPADSSMGFLIGGDDKGRPLYQVIDDAPALLRAQVQAAGFPMDPNTLEIVFEKHDWSGPFGAYEETPGAGRPAFTEGVDTRRKRAILSPLMAAVGFATATSTAISFSATGNTITGTGLFSNVRAGDAITITGSTGGTNDGLKRVVSAGANSITTTESITTQSAGPSVTVAVTVGTCTGAAEYNGSFYIQTSSNSGYTNDVPKTYVLSGWGSSPVFVLSNLANTTGYPNATSGDMFVFGAYLYALIISKGLTHFNGTNWVDGGSTGLGTSLADGLTKINNTLHRFKRPNLHSAATSAAADPTWASDDYIGDSSTNISLMLSLANSLLFAKEDGVLSYDRGNNISDIFPELKALKYTDNGKGSVVWHGGLYYPLSTSGLYVIKQGLVSAATPALWQEGQMELVPSGSEKPTFSHRIYRMVGDPTYLYAMLMSTDGESRLMTAEETSSGLVWRTLSRTSVGGSGPGMMALSSIATSGPVLWFSTPYAINYYIIASGPDPLQDSRCTFASTGKIYEPWLTCGCPEVEKEWAWLELVVGQKSADSGYVTFQVDAYTEDGDQIISAQTVTFTASKQIRKFIQFTNATVSKRTSYRVRLVLTMGNSNSAHTPFPISYKVHARAKPVPRNRYVMTVNTPASSHAYGLATQAQARTFINRMRSAILPMVLTDVNGISHTVIPITATIQEAMLSKDDSGRYSSAWQLSFLEEVAS